MIQIPSRLVARYVPTPQNAKLLLSHTLPQTATWTYRREACSNSIMGLLFFASMPSCCDP